MCRAVALLYTILSSEQMSLNLMVRPCTLFKRNGYTHGLRWLLINNLINKLQYCESGVANFLGRQ